MLSGMALLAQGSQSSLLIPYLSTFFFQLVNNNNKESLMIYSLHLLFIYLIKSWWCFSQFYTPVLSQILKNHPQLLVCPFFCFSIDFGAVVFLVFLVFFELIAGGFLGLWILEMEKVQRHCTWQLVRDGLNVYIFY